MKRTMEDLCWKEVVWRRPFELSAVHELLSHLASLVPCGALIWEARSSGGNVRYYLGTEQKYISKIENTFRTHGHVQFFNIPEHARSVISNAKQLKISHPTLSLKLTYPRR